MTKARDLANASTALSAVSATELAFVDGVTSAIQTQMDAKAPSSTAATLTGTQTLTNKTLTSPVLTTPTISTVDAKGDLLAGTADNTIDRLAVGNNGESLVADSSTSTGLRWQGNFAAGKNKIINGDFNIWQRGTSINVSAASYGYGADRWGSYVGGGGAAVTMSRQSFTPGTAPVAGYEGNFFLRYNRTTTGNTDSYLYQRIENVTTFAGQTVTVSFWAKAGSAVSFTTGDIYFEQDFGTGGSSAVGTPANNSTQAISTSWTRYSFTVAIPSISGKTIGSNSHLGFVFRFPTSMSTLAFDIWGVQVEAGSVATAFQTATGTLQGELAACQRYYYVHSRNENWANGQASSTSGVTAPILLPIEMRVAPTITLAPTGASSGNINFLSSSLNFPSTTGTISASSITKNGFQIVGSGFTSSFTAGNSSLVYSNGTNNVYTASSEL